MAIVQLKSSNPQFSFAISKNPASGMLLRSIRKGMGYGWFSDERTYNVYFKDADNEVSYKQHRDDQFEYLNTSRYTSPMAFLNMLAEYFDDVMKKKGKYDAEGFCNELRIPLVHIAHFRYVRFFKENFPDYTLNVVEKANKSYELSVKTEKTLQELLNYTSLLCLFFSIFANEHIDITNELIKKYVTVMKTLDAPFYIRYLFGRNVLNDRGRFNKHKEDLETTNRYKIDMKFGNTAIQRRDMIKSLIKNDKPILDVGCGEGFYAIPFARNNAEHFYYAIDIDSELVEIVTQKAEKAELDNLIAFNSIDSFLENYSDEQVDIIMTEVVEHMHLPDATKVVKGILDTVDFDKFVITTPNQEFNSFYAIEGFRHDDHKWEMKTDEFNLWINTLCEGKYSLEFFGIGDSVDGTHTTQGVLIEKKGVNYNVA
jgi:2-polyprenyl-3-methyl-5-hydroxy-6-metoxy-1,4-benzoquinol methylase